MTKIVFRIYKIDTEHKDLDSLELEEMPVKIIQKYNQLKDQVVFTRVGESPANIGENKHVIFFQKNNDETLPHSWKSFFEDTGVDFGEISTEVHHIVGFIINSSGGELFAIATGQAYVTFEGFVDYDFPLDVARKVVDPQIRSGEIKGLTGYLQASSIQFRRPHRVTAVESVGSIWTQLSGYMRKDILSSAEFEEIFGKKKKATIEIKASVGIKLKTTNYELLAKYIGWLIKVNTEYDVPPDAAESFGFLDAVKKISTRRYPALVEELNQKLIDKLRSNEYDDFDLCHREQSLYLNADDYVISAYRIRSIPLELPPTIDEVISAFGPAEPEQALSDYSVTAQYNAESSNDRTGTIKDLLCGEVSHNNVTYFLLNNEWYQLKDDFLSLIRSGFEAFVRDESIKANISLPEWTQRKEHEYNKLFIGIDRFLVGDTVFSENTELYDLLYWDDETLYIVHVKSGFAVKTRDVASQLFNSAQIIESDLATGGELLKSHYAKMVAKFPQAISEQDFLELFRKHRTYTLAYGLNYDVSENPGRVQSNIARLEIVQLQNDMRRFEPNASFNIEWIQKNN